jgi:hypothetical protein
MSDVLFRRGAGAADAWDDSALVAAWVRQLQKGDGDLPTSSDAAAESAAGTSSDESTTSTSGTGAADTAPAAAAAAAARKAFPTSEDASEPTVPAMPSWADARTRNALRAFYLCGYWAGVANTMTNTTA